MRANLHTLGIAWIGATLFWLGGCGAAQTAPQAAPERAPSPGVMAYLPRGAVAYGRLDLASLRESPHAARIIGWYRQFVPAIPGFEADDPDVRKLETLLGRTHDVAGALFAPNERLERRVHVEPMGVDEGVLVMLRADVDLEWIEQWAADSGVELVRRSEAGRPTLVSATPSREQLVVAELAKGLLVVGVGRLDDVDLRIEAAATRVAAGAAELADPDAAGLARVSGADRAPIGAVFHVPLGVTEELSREMGGAFEPADVAAVRGFALRVDPSDTLVIEVVLRTTGLDRADGLRRAIDAEAERVASTALVLLLGFDLWLDRTETRAEGDDVRSTMRLAEDDLRIWFFHVEHLAAAAKAFFADDGMGGIFGGLLSSGPDRARPPAAPPLEEMAPDEREAYEPPPAAP
jgi:hypothetical protein